MPWRINVHRDAAKQLDAIPPDRRQRILNDIRELAEDSMNELRWPFLEAHPKDVEDFRAAAEASPAARGRQIAHCILGCEQI
jgi:mRNA-degrading endonuclease RelE of RelBE toxin-antitoxin system